MTTTHPYGRAGGGHTDLPFVPTDAWTPAHSEVARFIGGCFAVGALCGVVVEMARPMREQRGHG